MTTLLDRLRHETRPVHEQTEQLFYTEALRNGTLSVAEYNHLLRTHLVFHQALETTIDNYPTFFQTYEPESRRKTAWLVADLTHQNVALPTIRPELFSDWSPAALLGAAYVGEGSMLGGTVIWQLLQKNQAIQPLLSQARFYQGYGPDTGRQWRSFGAFISQSPDAVAYPDEVVEAAQQAFKTYQTIFQDTIYSEIPY